MIGVDKPASLLYPPSFVSFSSSSPPAQHTQPGNRRGVLLLSRLWLPHSRVSMRFSSPVFFPKFLKYIYIYNFYSAGLTLQAGLHPWSQPKLSARRGSPLWPNNEVGKAAQIPSSSLCFQATFCVSANTFPSRRPLFWRGRACSTVLVRSLNRYSRCSQRVHFYFSFRSNSCV